MKTQKWAASGAAENSAPTLVATKVNVVEPLKEIQRLMDEVLFSPGRVTLEKEVERLQKELDALDTNSTKAMIHDLFMASLSPEQTDELSSVSLYDLNGVSRPITTIRSKLGTVAFFGVQGPFLFQEIGGAGDNDEE